MHLKYPQEPPLVNFDHPQRPFRRRSSAPPRLTTCGREFRLWPTGELSRAVREGAARGHSVITHQGPCGQWLLNTAPERQCWQVEAKRIGKKRWNSSLKWLGSFVKTLCSACYLEKCVRTGARLTPSHTLCALAWAVGAEEDECNAEQGSGCLFLITVPPAALRCSFVVSHLETHALAAIIARKNVRFHVKEFKWKTATTSSMDRTNQETTRNYV